MICFLYVQCLLFLYHSFMSITPKLARLTQNQDHCNWWKTSLTCFIVDFKWDIVKHASTISFDLFQHLRPLYPNAFSTQHVWHKVFFISFSVELLVQWHWSGPCCVISTTICGLIPFTATFEMRCQFQVSYGHLDAISGIQVPSECIGLSIFRTYCGERAKIVWSYWLCVLYIGFQS